MGRGYIVLNQNPFASQGRSQNHSDEALSHGSRYFRVLRENPYLISSSKLENGNVEFLLLIKLSLHHKQDDSERKRPLLRTVPTNSKVFLPRFMIIQEI